jgi:lipopolysaccharide transport system ATP-binding protein
MGQITTNGLGKCFKQYPSRWSRLFEWLVPWFGVRHQKHWVLHDINLQIEPGEAIAIVGVNGAGKSTLLKLIAGTLKPSAGTVNVRGRIAALLELGMGFHPDFTGRQNLFMAGQLLGLSPRQIESLLPEIEAFAEIGEYIDQPLRVYSSGMQVRLAFSVATAIRPDILIVDEALAVGDAYFQHKSFERILRFKEQGTTLLLVSHDKNAIQSICDRVILIGQGTVLGQGEPEPMMNLYNALTADPQGDTVIQESNANGQLQMISGTGEASVTEIALRDQGSGEIVSVASVGQPVVLEIRTRVNESIANLVCGFAIKNRLGQVAFGTNTALTGHECQSLLIDDEKTFRFSFVMNLAPGQYSLTTCLSSSETHLEKNYEWRDLAACFEVVNLNQSGFDGQIWLDTAVEIK